MRQPPSLCSIVSAALVLAFGPRFSLGEHQEAGLVEPDGARLWRVRHGSVPGWATGQPVGVRNSDQVLDLRLRNATAQTCQHLLGATDAGIRASVPLPWGGLPLRAWEPPGPT